MRVNLIANGSLAGTTGLGRYSSVLYAELLKSGADVSICPPKVPVPDPVMRQGKRLLNIDLETFFSDYPITYEHEQADIYHLAAENLASLLIFQKLQPAVVTVHAFFTYLLRNDPDLAMYNHVFHRLIDNLAMRGLFRADAIIAVSQYVADTLINELHIPADRIHVIHEAVDHDFFKPLDVPHTFREKYGLDPGYFYYLFVGSEQPRKNFLQLLEAFAEVRAKHPDVRLLKIGSPEFQSQRQRAVRRIHELGIEGDVTFIGHVGEELPLFYNACDVFVFPSLYEGFGFPPLEAMACGTPTISSNTASLPEVVGNAALLINPTDNRALIEAMEQMHEDAELRRDYGKIGLTRAGNFNWQRTAAMTASLYEYVLRTNRIDVQAI